MCTKWFVQVKPRKESEEIMVEGLATRRTFRGAMASTLILPAMAGPHEGGNQPVFVVSPHGAADGPASARVHFVRLA